VHVFGVFLAGLALGTGARALARRGKAGVAAAAAFLVVVVGPPAADRIRYLRYNNDLVRESASGYAAEGPALERAVEQAAADRMGRVYAGLGGPGQVWGGTFLVGWVPVYAWFPMREVDALGYLYHMASLNSDLHDAFDERNAAHYRALGVRRILAPADRPVPPFAREIAREGRFRVLDVPGPGLVDVVDAPYEIDVPKSLLARVQRAWLRSPLPARGIHPRVHVAEERRTKDPSARSARSYDFRFEDERPAEVPVGEIVEARRDGEDFVVRARVRRSGHLVLKMTYHPRWSVTVDGGAASTVHLLPSFVGVALDPGEHIVHFRYRADRSRSALAATGLLVLVAAGTLGRRLRL
jgi:hypothetical protein